LHIFFPRLSYIINAKKLKNALAIQKNEIYAKKIKTQQQKRKTNLFLFEMFSETMVKFDLDSR